MNTRTTSRAVEFDGSALFLFSLICPPLQPHQAETARKDTRR